MADFDLDFLMSGPAEGEVAGAVAEPKADKPATAISDSSRKSAIDDVVDVLLPSAEEPVDDVAARRRISPKTEEDKPEPAVRQPIVHDPQLLRLASSWGIGPDDAANYTTSESLLGAVAIRELRYRNAAATRAQTERTSDAEPDDGLAPPDFKVDDEADPSIKGAIESVSAYAQKLKEHTERQVAAMREELDQLRAGHEQAAIRESGQEEAKIAQLFDEKVASWGDEFKELLGVPQETWTQKPGTPQYAELTKLREYVKRNLIGLQVERGRTATLAEIGEFLEQGRYAIWRDQAKRSARREVADGLKKQRGGVGLRPGKARTNEQPEQGDEAAKAAIGDYMAEHGLDPWARRSA